MVYFTAEASGETRSLFFSAVWLGRNFKTEVEETLKKRFLSVKNRFTISETRTRQKPPEFLVKKSIKLFLVLIYYTIKSHKIWIDSM